LESAQSILQNIANQTPAEIV